MCAHAIYYIIRIIYNYYSDINHVRICSVCIILLCIIVYKCNVLKCVHWCGFGCVCMIFLIIIFVAGCTSFKPVLEYFNGLVEANQTLRRPDIHGPNTKKTLLRRLSQPERERRLNTYYKFMILRDPLERMMSGYKDKVSGLSV